MQLGYRKLKGFVIHSLSLGIGRWATMYGHQASKRVYDPLITFAACAKDRLTICEDRSCHMLALSLHLGLYTITFAKFSTTTPIWLLFTAACSIRS